MFETRLKFLLLLLTFALAIIVARLVDMQVIHADAYRQQAEDALLLPVKVFPAVRGRILDRLGDELATDEPCWDVRVDFGVLAMDPAYLTSRVDRFRRRGRYGKGLTSSQVEVRFLRDIDRMWSGLSRFSGKDVGELRARAKTICARIGRIREAVTAHRGFDTPVREERMRHAIVAGLNDQEQVAARETLGDYPWLRVESSTQRNYHAGEAFAHVLGRLGPVTAKRLKSDPFAEDPLRSYAGGEKLGVSGAERAAEKLLRGSRGRFRDSLDGKIIENVPPQKGRDVHLTVRRDLQERLYQLFERESNALPDHPGGSIVVLDIDTRDCLALISYPAFDPNRFQEDYGIWRRDTRRQPLRFRAVANQYAPGSIVKPLACLAGLNAGVITLSTTMNCQGALFPEHPDRWRCWADRAGNRMHHGDVDVTAAIKHSCNIFMYRTGQLLGAQQLCSYFDMVGFGRVTGTGLVEEVAGINPTPSWLASVMGQSVTPGKARHFAIGQAEVCVSPLQAANLMAVYGSGKFREICLIDPMRVDTEWVLPGDAANWRAIRRGLYGVVNDLDGTAHRTAYLDPSTGYAIYGKTGSAEARPWPISYAVPYVDSNGDELVQVMAATTRRDAVADFIREFIHEHPGRTFDHREVSIHERLPLRSVAQGRKHSHAWFAGYLHPLDGQGRPSIARTPRIAFAVMIEFGGSGGRVSAPVGKKVAQILIDTLGPELDPDVPLIAKEGPVRR